MHLQAVIFGMQKCVLKTVHSTDMEWKCAVIST